MTGTNKIVPVRQPDEAGLMQFFGGGGDVACTLPNAQPPSAQVQPL